MLPPGLLEADIFCGLARNVATASGTGVAGDVIAQLMAARGGQKKTKLQPKQPFRLDGRRTVALGAFNAAYTGAFQHFYFPHLNQCLDSPLARLAVNQGIFIPFLYYPILLWLVPLIRGRTARERARLRSNIHVRKLIPRNWAFWLPLQFIQFKFIPAQAQVVFCSMVGLVWSILLSCFASGSNSNNNSNNSAETTKSTSATDCPTTPINNSPAPTA